MVDENKVSTYDPVINRGFDFLEGNSMKHRRLALSAAATVAAAGLALVTAGSASAAAFTTDWGSKNVMVKRSPSINSVYYNGEDFNGKAITKCISLPFSTSTVWNSTGMQAPDGSSLNLITFTTPDCTSGYMASKRFTVPNYNSLSNFWADMTS